MSERSRAPRADPTRVSPLDVSVPQESGPLGLRTRRRGGTTKDKSGVVSVPKLKSDTPRLRRREFVIFFLGH